jgi:hypothetical protein
MKLLRAAFLFLMPPKTMVQSSDLVDQQGKFERHHQDHPDNMGGGRNVMGQFRQASDDLDDQADEQKRIIGPAYAFLQPGVDRQAKLDQPPQHMSLRLNMPNYG